MRQLYYNPLGGLGFFSDEILDTHFSAGFQSYTGVDSQGQPKISYTNLQVAIQAVQVPDRSNISLWSLAILGIVAQVVRRK